MMNEYMWSQASIGLDMLAAIMMRLGFFRHCRTKACAHRSLSRIGNRTTGHHQLKDVKGGSGNGLAPFD
jgi:hypothetical protein